MNKIYLLLIFIFTIFLSGCAFDLVHINQIPVEYETENIQKPSFKLTNEVQISLGTGYTRQLNKGTTWHYIRTISVGDIFKTNDQVLTIEGSNIFEAFIVVTGKNMVGFFLPVEETYSPLNTPQPLPMVSITK